MARTSDLFHKHDWHSQDYVLRWAERQDEREPDRKEQFQLLAETIPYPTKAPIKILDLGAGYGGLTQFLLEHFPKAIAVCQDGSDEMAELGKKRMKHLTGRFTYVLSDFSRPGWSSTFKEPFEAVVSAIAIHNVRLPRTIRRIYKDTYSLVKPGGCFLNFDRMSPSLEELMDWLTDAGFEDVSCFWKGSRRALFGGFRKR